MKNKTLIILLIIPFVIGLISFVSVVLLNINVASDISGINFSYRDQEGFKISDAGYELKATPIMDDVLILAPDNELTWYIKEDTDVAKIEEDESNNYYLYALKEGECTVVCSNIKKSVEREFKAIIYENGTILINPKYRSSGQQVEPTRYFGMYDLSYDEVKLDNANKVNAKIEFDIDVVGDTVTNGKVSVLEKSDNITYSNNTMTINSYSENSYFTLVSTEQPFITNTYTFNVVKDGVNVYNYNDLLMCTNFSSSGEIVVMQTSLGSLREVYEGKNVEIDPTYSSQGIYKYEIDPSFTKKEGNISLFGNYDEKSGTFNFANELVYMETTYNHKFIDDYNSKYGKNISTDIKVGIKAQKDFYGNGFSINMNNLCFPNNGKIDINLKKLAPDYTKDYFFGPLAYVTIGDPSQNDNVIVKAYGQDNVGLLLDADGITLNDLRIQNIDDNSNKRNYAFTGTVVEVMGKDVTIKNSTIRLGKNLVRAFDTKNLLIKNSILTRSSEFNLKVGSNVIKPYDTTKIVNVTIGGKSYSVPFNDFFDINSTNVASANMILEEFLGLNSSGIFLNNDEMYEALRVLQDALDTDTNEEYGSEVTLDGVLFDDSGLFSIGLESEFNGPFLYNGGSMTIISTLGGLLQSEIPNQIGGTSLPSKINIIGNTKFYDWKKYNDIDTSSLIEERISSMISSDQSGENILTIDDFFPMKPILRDMCKSKGLMYYKDDEEYINTMIAYYGGGANNSTIINNISSDVNTFSEELNVNLLTNLDKYIGSFGDDLLNLLAKVLSKCVLFAAGFEPFKFITNGGISLNDTPELFNENPQVSDLKANL